MKFEIGSISIQELINLYESNKLNLEPPYQRNAVWTKVSKQLLLNSIMDNLPLPNFFFQKLENSTFDMVDGQQRTRTILAYYYDQLEEENGRRFKDCDQKVFLEYEIPLVTITEVDGSHKIEAFYARVNSSGARLNRPELLKAKFFETRFLKLVEDLSSFPEYENLNLFSETSQVRMNDIDFTAELVGLILLGRTDKKQQIDKIFERDLTEEECSTAEQAFKTVVSKFVVFNSIHPIKKSRYKQRNDFYTLFDFILHNRNRSEAYFRQFFETLIFIGDDILPSTEECEPFQQYAFHCISQSNSKAAREARYQILTDIFLNQYDSVSDNLKKVLDYYELDHEDLIDVDGISMINLEVIK